jgi:hypothetical protein
MPHYKDITGQKFGEWTALRYVCVDKNRNAVWACVNESGEKKDISVNHLRQFLRERLWDVKRRGSEKYYLGSLCKYGHEYKETGQSQRYKIGGDCTVCGRLRSQIARKKVKK